MTNKSETEKSASQEITDLKEQLLTQPLNYIDFLTHAIAKCNATEFDFDPSKWNKVIAEFKEEEQVLGFNLFDDVYFDMRRPDSLYSAEVSGFLAVMRRSGNFTVCITAGRGKYRMDSLTKSEIIKSEEKIFQSQKEYLDRLTLKIDSQLGLNSS